MGSYNAKDFSEGCHTSHYSSDKLFIMYCILGGIHILHINYLITPKREGGYPRSSQEVKVHHLSVSPPSPCHSSFGCVINERIPYNTNYSDPTTRSKEIKTTRREPFRINAFHFIFHLCTFSILRYHLKL